MSERGRSRTRGGEGRARARSTERDVERTARSLSQGSRSCSRERARHILDAHGSPALAREEEADRGKRPSAFASPAECRKAVGRALLRPDATAPAGNGRRWAFKTYNRTIGDSGRGHGVDDAPCPTVAVLLETNDRDVVTAYPIPTNRIAATARGRDVHWIKDRALPPSLLSEASRSDDEAAPAA